MNPMEQMCSEYEMLKERLSSQEIINDRLMRETMKSKVGSIRSTVRFSVICALFVMISTPFVFHYNPVVRASWLFVIATELLMVMCLFLDWKFNHNVQNTDLACCDLLTFSKNVRKLRSDYKEWMKWGILLGFLWGGWLCAETLTHSAEPKAALAMVLGLSVGLVTGCFIGYRMDKRIIATCDDLISQIEG